MENDIKEATKISTKLFDEISNGLQWISDNIVTIMLITLQIALVIVAAFLIMRVTKLIVRRMVKKRSGKHDEQANRVATIATLMQSIIAYCVLFIAAIIVLSMLGVGDSVASAVTAASIGGVAIGFGAQNLVKDVVTGLFLMFENQYAVGDYIKTGEFEGVVEAIALRVTYLRSFRGDQIIIPNGTIERVVNYTRGGYLAKIEIATSYESDTRMVIQIINDAVQRYAENYASLIVERPRVLGVSSFEQSSVNVTVVCKSRPMMQWDVERGMRLAVKEAFDAAGIPFPYPHVSVMRDGEKNMPPQAPQHSGSRVVPVWQKDDYRA